MKISGEQVNKVLQSYTKQVENKKTKKTKQKDEKSAEVTRASFSSDLITISNRNSEVAKAKAAYNDLPEVRQELVNEIREKIKSGNYNVSSKQVADKIIHRAIVDKMV